MSTISNVHTVSTYIEGTSKALPDNRGVLIFYRKDAKTGIKKASQFVSVPTIQQAELDSNMAQLMPHLRNFVETQQNNLIRELVEAGAQHLTTEQITIPAIINWLGETSNGTRFSKQLVSDWFDSDVLEPLVSAIVTMNPSLPATQIEANTNSIKALIVALAGDTTKLFWQQAQIDRCNKVLSLVVDDVSSKLKDKLSKVQLAEIAF
jgi:hypothetical protein